MSNQPTTTRATLRRHLARRLRMPFAVNIADSSTVTGGTSSAPIDTARLVQGADDIWRKQFFYDVTADAQARISAFNHSTHALTLESAISSFNTGDVYEIHSIWSAADLHYALNQALHAAFPAFFEYVSDESLIYQENVLQYGLTTLSKPLWRLSKIFMEWNASVLRGPSSQSLTGAAGSLTDPGLIGALGQVNSFWKCSIYAGTSAGSLGSVTSVNNATGQVNVSPNWQNGAPDSTSKYALWNPQYQKGPWLPIQYGRPDEPEWPSNFYHDFLVPTSYGLRMRIKGGAQPKDMAADTDATMVPEEYLLSKAAGICFDMLVDDNRGDRQRYAALAQEYDQRAEAFKTSQYFRPPDGQWWGDGRPIEYMDSADPLGWRAGRRDY